jgi:hypothetical protein
MERPARVCPQCGSHQGWFSSTRDPRFFLVSVLGWLSAVCIVAFVIHHFTDEDRKKSERSLEPTCRGLVVVAKSDYAVQKSENSDKLLVRVLLENKFKGDVSEPVVRVDVLGKNDDLIDTFVRTVYAANLPGMSSAWFRVADILAVDPSAIISVKASLQRADCHGSWR